MNQTVASHAHLSVVSMFQNSYLDVKKIDITLNYRLHLQEFLETPDLK